MKHSPLPIVDKSWVWALLAILIPACGPSGNAERPEPFDIMGRQDEGEVPEPTSEPSEDEPPEDDPSMSVPASAMSTREVPESGCAGHSGAGVEIYSPEDSPGPLRGLHATGQAWVADGAWASGVVRFSGENGASREFARLGDFDRAVVLGEDSYVASVSEGRVSWARFDASELTEEQTVWEGAAYELAAGSSGSEALLVWAGDSVVLAHRVNRDGPVGGVLVLDSGADTDAFALSIAAAEEGRYAVVWTTRRRFDGSSRTHLTFVEGDDTVQRPMILRSTLEEHRLVDLVSWGAGYSVLLAEPGGALLMTLDQDGIQRRAPLRLKGAQHVHGLGTDGSELLLAAEIAGDRDAVRSIDAMLAPTGVSEWLCLYDEPSDQEHVVSIAFDGSEYGVLYRDPEGGDRLLRVAASSSD